jgi:hypothetical protein
MLAIWAGSKGFTLKINGHRRVNSCLNPHGPEATGFYGALDKERIGKVILGALCVVEWSP